MISFNICIPDSLAYCSSFAFFCLLAAFVTTIWLQRDAVLGQLHLRQRRTSGAITPHRDLSPVKKSTSEKRGLTETTLSPSVFTTPDHTSVFPPSRRWVLPLLAEFAASPQQQQALSGLEPSKDVVQAEQLSRTESFRSIIETASPKYLPNGFSTVEVQALGDFPAYDILSGVRLPKAYKDFDPLKALARPYRPFRWAYHQTMSLTKMEPDWWLEVDNTYAERIAQRQELFKLHGKKVLDYLPGSELACKELMEMALQFLTHRYPKHFTLTSPIPNTIIFTNKILNTTIQVSPLPPLTHPLHTLLNNVPEDFAITTRNETDGLYYFRAGCVCSAMGWSVATKIGKSLKQIHDPIVPDYKEKMAFSMDRFFSKMPSNSPIQRGSWGLEVGKPLFAPPGSHHLAIREIQDEKVGIEDVNLRVDWQTLRRLPLSGAVVFNFKALFTPVTEFRDERGVPGLVLKVLKEGKRSLMEYKGTWHVEHVVVSKLEEWVREQGMEEVEVSTLEKAPFFEGWEEKWHRLQGV